MRSGRAEAHRLDRRGHSAGAERSAVSRQHHVGAPLEHVDLLGKSAWSTLAIGSGEDVEHELAWGCHLNGRTAQRPNAATPSGVQGERAFDGELVAKGAETG